MTLFSSILMTALVAQLPGEMIQGKVVDDEGKPAADARVFYFAPRPWNGGGNLVEVATKTDATGRFRLAAPPRKRANWFLIWAYRPGSAIAAKSSNTPPFDLVLRQPRPRKVQVEGPDGRPIPGAIISPRILYPAAQDRRSEVPEALANLLAVTTRADGTATIDYVAVDENLLIARLTAPAIGTQDLQLLENPYHGHQDATIDIHLGPTRRLAGRVRNRSGKPVAGQEVEVWFKGSTWLPNNPVVFQNGPVRTAADGSFRTPENLLVGSSYQVVIRAPGFEPALSKWITIGDQPPLLLPMLQRPLRMIRGRVVDRQDKPLAEVEVFQSGDGPERTATKTDSDGRFALGGFREGPVFLSAQGGFPLLRPADQTRRGRGRGQDGPHRRAPGARVAHASRFNSL